MRWARGERGVRREREPVVEVRRIGGEGKGVDEDGGEMEGDGEEG